MSSIWGPERRLRRSEGTTGASEGTPVQRTDGKGNPILPQDALIQGEADYLRGRVRALEGAIDLLLDELWRVSDAG